MTAAPPEALTTFQGNDGARPGVDQSITTNAPDAVPPLDALLDPVARCFTPETARALVALPPNRPVHQRMEELRRKAGEGSLTPAEREEYQALMEVGDVISIL